ncbi:Gamma-interferon-inducible lysosomal thiol reductase [Portunus trituberculatus]|uniref:Gamma-interferon-inducible lysosomal thiol reductase n=1 Tax=Portunus trituberculatus TaxID=210409 RepID=A0A5B7EH38_PORTR|nr:Gamma-interferon-inducible lysosomal thiol reductase [Portunus trituberculatus]
MENKLAQVFRPQYRCNIERPGMHEGRTPVQNSKASQHQVNRTNRTDVEVLAVNISSRIPDGGGKARGGAGLGGQVWTSILLCVVLTLVLVNDMVTYGAMKDVESTTEKDGKYTFTCQHGAVECRANTVHACVTNAIRDEEKQLDIVSCMIERNEQPMKVGQKSLSEQTQIQQDLHKVLCRRYKGPKPPSC